MEFVLLEAVSRRLGRDEFYFRFCGCERLKAWTYTYLYLIIYWHV